jgi:hypothetical protein
MKSIIFTMFLALTLQIVKAQTRDGGYLITPVPFTSVKVTDTTQEKIVVNIQKRGATVSPSMYGIFFEEINHAGDGGLYAELVQNRSFEDGQLPEGYSLEITVNDTSQEVAVVNGGYWGMSIEAGGKYHFRFNSEKVIGRSSYYVQQMASLNRPDYNVKKKTRWTSLIKSIRRKAGLTVLVKHSSMNLCPIPILF